MQQLSKTLSLCFASGVVGGAVNAVFPILLASLGLLGSIDIHPEPNKADLYQKAFWGGALINHD